MPPKGSRPAVDKSDASPEKRSRSQLPDPSGEALKASFLNKATSGQLLSRLLESHKTLDGVAAPYVVEKAFVNEILKKEYCANPNADVQVVAACIIADVMRLAPSGLPFPDSKAADALSLFCVSIKRMKTGKSSYALYVRHILERLAASRMFGVLVSKVEKADDDVDALFETLLYDVSAEDDAMVSNMAQILTDILGACQSITDVQLDLLIKATSASHKESNRSGYRAAAATIQRQEDLLQPAVLTYVTGGFDDAAEELHRIDVSDGDANERKAVLKNIVVSIEAMVQLSAVSINVVVQVFPALTIHLNNEHNDIRLLATRGYARAFETTPALLTEYASAYHTFLSRAADPRPIIRTDVVKFVANILLARPDMDTLWAQLTPILINKLVDSEESIRKAAIEATVRIATQQPNRTPRRLVEHVGQRCRDKRPAVRNMAVEQLASLYGSGRGKHFQFIPDVLFLAAQQADVGISAIEFSLASMLPQESASEQKAKPTLVSMPVFDFESRQDGSAASDGSMVGAFAGICGGLSKDSRLLLMQLMGKKHQLRQTVLKLFELRSSLQQNHKSMTVEERDELAAKIRRLLTFLQQITHAEKDEWSTIFKELRDERCVKAIMTLCSSSCMDFGAAASDVLGKLRGRTKAEVTNFFKNNLLPRLALPFSSGHAQELMESIEIARHQGGKDSEQAVGLLRALCAMGKMAPQFMPPLAAKLVQFVKDDTELYAKGDDTNAQAVTEATLEVLSTISTASEGALPKALSSQSKQIISIIGRVCLMNSSGSVAKSAARCLVALYAEHASAFQQLLSTISERIAALGQDSSPIPPQVISWLKTVTVIAATLPTELSAKGQSLFESIGTLMLRAAKTASHDGPETLDVKSKKLKTPLLQTPCFSAEIVDASAKAIVTYVRWLPANRAPLQAKEAYDCLIKAYKASSAVGLNTVGAALKRLAINKQLAKLLLNRTTDVSKEMTAVMFLSSEENNDVRAALCAKLAQHIRKHQTDMRYVAILFMMAIGEEHRSTYMTLKGVVHDVSERLREQQANSGVVVSDSRAPQCYLEYTIPFLVLFMAHHVFFDSEAATNFTSYQRVWHLLFDELFKAETKCASFVAEMLRKIKGHDDGLAPDSNRTRVMCDLGSKVMLAVMGQKAAGIDSIKQFPGAVLLPQYFVRPADPNRFPDSSVYLDSSFTVSSHAPFKVVTVSATPAKSMAQQADGDDADLPAADGLTPVAPRDNNSAASPTPGFSQKSASVISAVVTEMTEGMSAEDIASLPWKQARVQIENALGSALNDTAKAIALEALRAAHAAATEAEDQ